MLSRRYFFRMALSNRDDFVIYHHFLHPKLKHESGILSCQIQWSSRNTEFNQLTISPRIDILVLFWCIIRNLEGAQSANSYHNVGECINQARAMELGYSDQYCFWRWSCNSVNSLGNEYSRYGRIWLIFMKSTPFMHVRSTFSSF